jgi:hypothetical protein
VLGVPGKSAFETIAGELQGLDAVWIIPDPDAQQAGQEWARRIGGARVVTLNRKIDDNIIAHNLSGDWVKALLDTGKMVK